MTIDNETTSRTEHLLALMTNGDDLFNATQQFGQAGLFLDVCGAREVHK